VKNIESEELEVKNIESEMVKDANFPFINIPKEESL
jgi:hypothetical protein